MFVQLFKSLYLLNLAFAEPETVPEPEKAPIEIMGLKIPAGVWPNVHLPKKGVKAFPDLFVAHTPQKDLYLDLYLPEEKAEGPLPLVVWVHGGGWQGGTRKDAVPFHLLKQGYAVASIMYRYSQEALFPAQLHDCKAAIRWLRAHADEYGIDPTRIGVWGGSAGGHLVCLLGTTGNNKELEGEIGGNLEHSSRVQAVCNYCGPTDLFLMNAPETREKLTITLGMIRQLMGGPIEEHKDLARLASPVYHVTGNEPPFLNVNGDSDTLVPPNQAEAMHNALVKAGSNSRLHIVKNMWHILHGKELDEMVFNFFDENLKRAQKPGTYPTTYEDPTPFDEFPVPAGMWPNVKLPEGAQVYKDVVFAKTPQRTLLLDLYLPTESEANKPFPLIVWIHGGGWAMGARTDGVPYHLVGKGYAVASIAYRYSQEAIFPAQVHDCKAAIRWLRANAAKYNLAPERIGVWGISAGGHLVSMLGTTNGNREMEGNVGGNLEHSSDVQAVCSFCGPTDLFFFQNAEDPEKYAFPLGFCNKFVGGSMDANPDLTRQASPIHHVSGSEPPFLLVTGGADPWIPTQLIENFYNTLRKAGATAQFHIVPKGGHLFWDKEVDRMVWKFFGKHIR